MTRTIRKKTPSQLTKLNGIRLNAVDSERKSASPPLETNNKSAEKLKSKRKKSLELVGNDRSSETGNTEL